MFKPKHYSAWSALLTLALSWALVFAGTTGKIAGKVTDKETGEPMPGANVVVVGTTLGAATNVNGEYFILNVPPGSYDVRASVIGYSQILEKGVRVNADLTVKVDFALPSETLQLGEVVEVIAERPLIQKDVTASSKISNEEQIQALPVTTFQDAVSLSAGTQGSGNNLHIRGGRAGEVAYLVDGLSIEDPQNRSIGLNVGRGALSELQIISGGFNAEYGNAQSGVILLNTQEGRQKFAGRFFYQTDHLGDNGFGDSFAGFDWYEGSISGSEPITTHLLPKIGIKIPGYMTYFFQGETRLSNRATFHSDAIKDLSARSLTPESAEIRTSPRLRNETIFNRLFNIGDPREDVRQNWDSKLVWQLAANKKLTFGYRGNNDQTHGWSFVFGNDIRQAVSAAQRAGISDLLDQDNDGTRDEEILNGEDDDGDGRIDEDSRLDESRYRGDFAWGLDNDGDGRSDEEAFNNIDDDGDGQIDEDLQPYDWKGYDQNNRNENRANQFNLGWTHTLSSKTFYEVKLGRFYTFAGSLPKLGRDGVSRSSFEELEGWLREHEAALASGIAPVDLPKHIDPYLGFGNAFEPFVDGNGNGAYDRGESFTDRDGDGLWDLNGNRTNQIWIFRGANHPFRGQRFNGSYWVADRSGFNKRSSTVYTLKLDLTSQATNQHQLKAGVEASYFDLQNLSRQLTAPFDGRGLFGNEYHVFPNYQAVYVQDKMEFSSAIVNLGFRVERFDQGKQVAQNVVSPFVPTYDPPKAKYSFLPRVGFSFPVTEKDLFYFNYGRFFQRPILTNVYNQVNQTIESANDIVGNPNLDPEETIQYEFGIRHQFGLNTLFTVAGFFKDIDNLIQINQRFDENGLVYRTYYNDTYGTVKGLEVQLNQRAGRFFSGEAVFTFQVAKTTFSGAADTYTNENIFAALPGTEYPADWDERQNLVLNLDYHYGRGEGPRIGNLRLLQNWNINVLAQFSTGLPYTPENGQGVEQFELANTKRVASSFNIDLRSRRFFDLTGRLRAGLVLEVRNLLDRRNVIGPDNNGIVDAFRNLVGYVNAGSPDGTRNYGGYANAPSNPNAWSSGRLVRLGLSMEF